MKYIYFNAEKLDHSEILKDPSLKSLIAVKITFKDSMIIGLREKAGDDITSYIMLKYGDYVKDMSNMCADRSPIIGIDYSPQKKTALNVLKSK